MLHETLFCPMAQDVPYALEEGVVVEDWLGREATSPERATPPDVPSDLARDVGLKVADEVREEPMLGAGNEVKVVGYEGESKQLNRISSERTTENAADKSVDPG